MKGTLYLLFVLGHALAFTFWPCIVCSTSGGTISDSCTTDSDGAPYSFSCTPLDPSLPSWCCPYQINGAWVCNFASDEDDPGDTDAPDDCSMPSECGCYAPDGAKFTEGQIAGIVIGCVAGFVLLCCIWIYFGDDIYYCCRGLCGLRGLCSCLSDFLCDCTCPSYCSCCTNEIDFQIPPRHNSVWQGDAAVAMVLPVETQQTQQSHATQSHISAVSWIQQHSLTSRIHPRLREKIFAVNICHDDSLFDCKVESVCLTRTADPSIAPAIALTLSTNAPLEERQRLMQLYTEEYLNKRLGRALLGTEFETDMPRFVIDEMVPSGARFHEMAPPGVALSVDIDETGDDEEKRFEDKDDDRDDCDDRVTPVGMPYHEPFLLVSNDSVLRHKSAADMPEEPSTPEPLTPDAPPTGPVPASAVLANVDPPSYARVVQEEAAEQLAIRNG